MASSKKLDESPSEPEKSKTITPSQSARDYILRAKRAKSRKECRCAAFQYYSAKCSHPYNAKRYYRCGLNPRGNNAKNVFCKLPRDIPVYEVKDVLIQANCKICIRNSIRWSRKAKSDGQTKNESESEPSDLEAAQLKLLEGSRLKFSKKREPSHAKK
ncbi:hypothetical protein GGR53DRAFT_493133 [Hypoxylon sp. FL1150]|nr:hypothetical protein GGR53DRAFT_493133 [Hypoxylon sp. FL1150]